MNHISTFNPANTYLKLSEDSESGRAPVEMETYINKICKWLRNGAAAVAWIGYYGWTHGIIYSESEWPRPVWNVSTIQYTNCHVHISNVSLRLSLFLSLILTELLQSDNVRFDVVLLESHSLLFAHHHWRFRCHFHLLPLPSGCSNDKYKLLVYIASLYFIIW